jgi:hypothetical protein
MLCKLNINENESIQLIDFGKALELKLLSNWNAYGILYGAVYVSGESENVYDRKW